MGQRDRDSIAQIDLMDTQFFKGNSTFCDRQFSLRLICVWKRNKLMKPSNLFKGVWEFFPRGNKKAAQTADCLLSL